MKFKPANEGMGERGSDGNLAVSPTPRFAVSFFPFAISPIRSH
jgi:hypothetical protein